MTVWGVILELISRPRVLLIDRWNWKSAIFSATLRAGLFLCANLAAGWRAASGAMLAEFLYRSVTAGFYGALTQAFGAVKPAWAAGIAAGLLLPAIAHSLELGLHVLRGTPRIMTSLVSSVCFTVVSTLFNLYAMRRGALVVGDGSRSIFADLRQMPRLIGGFLAAACTYKSNATVRTDVQAYTER